MQRIHDKEGAKLNNARLDLSNLTCDHCDGVTNKYLLKYILVDVDVLIQNNKELYKNDNKRDSSTHPDKLFEEVYDSKLKEKIANGIKKNINVIIQKQLDYKHFERENRLLEFIWKQISSLIDKFNIKHTILFDVLQDKMKFQLQTASQEMSITRNVTIASQ